MARINLLYVITKLELGGAQKQLLDLISSLDKTRYNVFLITAKEGILIPDAQAIPELTLELNACLERPINPIKDILALIKIGLFIKRNDIRIVHTHSSKAGILGRWAAVFGRCTLLHTVHGWSFNDHQSAIIRGLFIFLERITAVFTHKIIVVCESDRKKGLRHNIGSIDKYALVHYGIDLSSFELRGKYSREEFGFKKDDLVVGTVCCLKPQKCPRDFIMFARTVSRGYPHAKFLLIGDGVLRRRMERLITAYKLENNVTLLGWRRDIAEILQIMDIFVLTSLWEGLPITVLEAMAASLPVVVTDTGGVEEIVKQGTNGFLVKPHDMEEMSRIVISLAGDPASRMRLGNSAHELIKRNDFGVDAMCLKTENLYRVLISRKDNKGLYN